MIRVLPGASDVERGWGLGFRLAEISTLFMWLRQGIVRDSRTRHDKVSS